ncbi:MAG TPA: hypothetical protein PLZ99_01455 [Parcubacteria group bacterium]|jgi:hypothetical protein|nr:hypothetical protein [Parcubacteria group bacterium]
MVVVLHAFVSHPGGFEPISISYGNIETATKGLRRQFGDSLQELSPGLFKWGDSLLKVVHAPFIDLFHLNESGELRDIVSELQKSKRT